MTVEKQTTRVWEDSSKCPETTIKNVFKNSFSGMFSSLLLLSGVQQQHFLLPGIIMIRLQDGSITQYGYLIGRVDISPEMKFFDINLTKGSSIFPHAIHSPFYRRNLQKTTPYFCFKIHTKKLWNKKPRDYSWNHFVGQKNEGRKPELKNSSLRRLKLLPRNFN